MVAYADTSFLYSLYGHDANSAQARTMGNSLKAPFAITPLQRHELRNAFRLALFRGVMTLDRCQAVRIAPCNYETPVVRSGAVRPPYRHGHGRS